MSYLASQLASLALATNFLTVITVVVCFMVMVVFIRQFRYYSSSGAVVCWHNFLFCLQAV